MRQWISLSCVLAVVAILISGASTQVTAQSGGSIAGEVEFSGTPLAPKVLKVNEDNEVCGKHRLGEFQPQVGQAHPIETSAS